MNKSAAIIFGLLLGTSLVISSYLLANSALKIKQFDRIVTVKGLSEYEVKADTAIWPIRFSTASNDASHLYTSMESNVQTIIAFLRDAGFEDSEISINAAQVTDRLAESWSSQNIALRYSGVQTVTVYSTQIDLVRETEKNITELGKKRHCYWRQRLRFKNALYIYAIKSNQTGNGARSDRKCTQCRAAICTRFT